MRRNVFRFISLLLLLTLFLTVLYSCKKPVETDTESGEQESSESSVTEGSVSSSEYKSESESSESVTDTTEQESSESSITEVAVSSSESGSECLESDTEDSGESSEGLEGSESDVTAESEIRLDIENGDFIVDANKYANGVQAYFEDSARTQFTVKNTEMSLTYNRTAAADQLVSSLVNSHGVSYISDTMDVFVKMKKVSKT